MTQIYNSTAMKIACDLHNENKSIYSVWEKKILIQAATACITAFRERYPQANNLKNQIGKYGTRVYKSDENMIFKFNTHTISYTHKEVKTVKIYLDVSGDVETVKVDLKLLNGEKTLVNKGRSSTAVNLIHAIDV